MKDDSSLDINGHNERLEAYVSEKIEWLKSHPTDTERQMREFLRNQSIKFFFKKALYVRSSSGLIRRYQIVDFYIPEKNTIISIGYKPYLSNSKYDGCLQETLGGSYPKMKYLHWSSSDFRSYHSMKNLIAKLK